MDQQAHGGRRRGGIRACLAHRFVRRGGWIGIVVLLGDNYNFQLGDGAEKYTINPTPPTGLPAAASAIAVYEGGTLALSGGAWYGWGYGWNGELCDGSAGSRTTPASTGYPTDALEVAGGAYHLLVLTPDGGVQGCGDDGSGQLGQGRTADGTPSIQTSIVPVTDLSSGVTDIAAGATHSLAVMDDGSVRSWGSNQGGQLGDGTTANRSVPVPVTGLANAVSVAAGDGHSLALTADGTVVAWGQNAIGELGDGTQTRRTTPVPVQGLTDVIAIAASNSWSMALKDDGTVWTWGGNFAGALGTGGGNSATPQQVPAVSGITALAAGQNHAVALKDDGTVITWGDNVYRQLGNATSASPGLPSSVTGLTDVVAIGAGRDHTSVLRNDGTVLTWGGNVSGSSSATHVDSKTSPAAVVPPGDAGVQAVAGGYGHALALTSGGGVLAWGSNSYGQLGDGGNSTSATPLPVAGLTGVRQVATSLYYASYALREDGTVAAWGSNDNGELGDGTTTTRRTPVDVTGLDQPASSIAAGGFHGLAVMADSTVRAWGHNYFGQLGDQTTTASPTAVTVDVLADVVAVGAGEFSSYAVTRAGALYAWGNNQNGQLGDGTTTDRSMPTLVVGLTNIVAVAGGYNHAIALRNDGTVWSWGANSSGMLGDGTTSPRSVPGLVPGLTDIVAISTRGHHNLALKGDGTVVAWGYNGGGQVGNRNTNDVPVPTEVTGLAGPVQAIGAGTYSSYAVIGVGDSDDDGVSDDVDDNAAGAGCLPRPHRRLCRHLRADRQRLGGPDGVHHRCARP